MQTRYVPFFALLAASLIIGCSKEERVSTMASDSPASATEVAGGGDKAESQTRALAERMVIKSAQLTIEHDAPEQTVTQAEAIVQSHGGFILHNNVRQQGEAKHVSLKLRVPSEKFEATLGKLRALGDVSSEAVTGEDVTEEFTDLQAQLRNQRALESRFIELLSQSASVAETIEVERELSRVRTEVERLEGRTKFLADRVALSTIEVELRPPASLMSSTTTIGSEVADAFADSGEIMAVVIGGLIRFAAALIPIGAAFALFIFLLRAILNRRKRAED